MCSREILGAKGSQDSPGLTEISVLMDLLAEMGQRGTRVQTEREEREGAKAPPAQ